MDIVIDLEARRIPELARALEADFDVDALALADAFRRGRSYDVYSKPEGIKVDLFPERDAFGDSQLARRQLVSVEEAEEAFYMEKWAETLGVRDLLEKALRERVDPTK